jgi:hypothetical protein
LLASAVGGGGLVAAAGGLDAAELLLAAGGAQFLGDVPRRPRGLGLVRAAPCQQLSVGQAAHVDALDAGHDGECGVPFGAGLGERGRGLGPIASPGWSQPNISRYAPSRPALASHPVRCCGSAGTGRACRPELADQGREVTCALPDPGVEAEQVKSSRIVPDHGCA